MPTTQELLSSFPKKPTENTVKAWIERKILPNLEESKPEGDGAEIKVKLTTVEASLYRELIKLYGEPRHIDAPKKRKKEYEGANPALLLIWAFNKKYHLGLRYRTIVDDDNIFRYDLKH